MVDIDDGAWRFCRSGNAEIGSDVEPRRKLGDRRYVRQLPHPRLLADGKARSLPLWISGSEDTHPGSSAFFSEQDDANEAKLARTAAVNGVRGLGSIVLGGDGSIRARLWRGPDAPSDAAFVQMVGGRFTRWTKGAAGVVDADHLDRQARLFGPSFNPVLRGLRIAVIDLGGTGSAVAALLAGLGVG